MKIESVQARWAQEDREADANRQAAKLQRRVQAAQAAERKNGPAAPSNLANMPSEFLDKEEKERARLRRLAGVLSSHNWYDFWGDVLTEFLGIGKNSMTMARSDALACGGWLMCCARTLY